MSFQHYEAPSVIAARRQAKVEEAERQERVAKQKASTEALFKQYRQADEAMRMHEADLRAQAEKARREYEEIERLARERADEMERSESIEHRAKAILAERQAVLDPQTASAYDLPRAPRVEGDPPRFS